MFDKQKAVSVLSGLRSRGISRVILTLTEQLLWVS